MKRPEEVKRLFTKTDEEVLEQSDLLLDSFQENKDPFIERFPQLADPFADEWASANANARGVNPDYAVVAEQTTQSSSLDHVMEQGRTLFQMVMIYTQLSFPDNPSVLRLFGQHQYESARSSQLKLPTLLHALYAQVTKPEYQPALMERGLKQEEIDALQTTALEITNQNAAVQRAKKNRTWSTGQRVVAMNAVWEKMALVCQCAKLVFQNDAARYNLFLLTESETPKPADKTTAPEADK
jgi:hypothetical protein